MGSKRGRLEATTESRGGNQGDEKKGKTCTRRQAWERKKEGKPEYLGAYVVKTSFRKTGLVKKEKATGQLYLHHCEALNISKTREAKS
jgi:hypothetical protein